MKGIITKVQELPETPNVCRQILREVWKSESVSIAHVEMAPCSTSLLHRHSSFTELYYILRGLGMIYIDNEEFEVKEGTLIEILPGVSHKLKNISPFILEHLVISSPAFKPDDVEVLNA